MATPQYAVPAVRHTETRATKVDPVADARVRPAQPTDAAELGRIQATTWQQAYSAILPPESLESLTAEIAGEAWRRAITEPPSEGHVVLTAYESSREDTTIVGFAALTPAADDEQELTAPTAELATILVEPRWGRRGHGARLLSAAVAHARGRGADHLIAWVLGGDKATEAFLTSAGWDRDGWTRPLDTGDRQIAQHRYVTDISAVEPDA